MRKLLVITILALFCAGSAEAGWKIPGFGGGGTDAKKAKSLVRQAQGAYGSADYSKVIKLTTEAITLDSKSAKAYALRGKAKKDMGDVDSAFQDLNKAVELDPNLGEAFFIRAQTHEIMGEMDKAGADYQKACAANYKEACR